MRGTRLTRNQHARRQWVCSPFARLNLTEHVLDLAAHPHAEAVLGAALKDSPAHAYLLHGPAGSGKREVARAFAGELLAKGAKDPDNVKVRAEHGSHPDLTWVTPIGRARDAPQGRRRDGRRRRLAHAVRGARTGSSCSSAWT